MTAYTLTLGLLGLYVLVVVLITAYCLLQLNLWYYYRNPRVKMNSRSGTEDFRPRVTIQLPIYNEKYVIERLVKKITKIQYPKELLQIQILDDSTDDTIDISKKLVEKYKSQGFDISLIYRTDRKGYKAGALDNGLGQAKGAFIAIFDADFLPSERFLIDTLPYFQNPDIGVVQTRWTHLNEDYSLLTRLQALQLNVHFTVEQQGRSAGDLMLQFNGTAGIWRKETIQKAGGWQIDTITEDLDLSYRAQMSGYKIQYLEHIASPAELPVEMSSLKSQQFRWMKGGAETARKILPRIWKNKSISLKQKFHATGHLMNSSIFLLILITGLLSLPLMFLLRHFGIEIPFLSVGFAGLLSIVFVYYEANVRAVLQKDNYTKRLLKFLVLFPVFLSLSMGLSLHNAIAVIQGYLGRKTAFVRTPKFNIVGQKQSWKNNVYLKNRLSGLILSEGILGACFLFAFVNGLLHRDFGFLYIHFMFAIGFLSIFYYSVKHGTTR
jgi:cellulose synthase/poly-beta-1,6-N-acetylglucosamine synthase-like glycosyltransferase